MSRSLFQPAPAAPSVPSPAAVRPEATASPSSPPRPTRRTRRLAVGLGVALSALVISAGIDAAPTVETFTISFGDVVSDGSPDPGAGNLDIGEASDSYRFSAAPGDEAILDVLDGSAGAFRWSLTSPTGLMLLDGALFTDRQLVLDESGVYTATVSGATPTTIGTYSFQLVRVPSGDEFVISLGDTVSDGVPGVGAGNIEAPGARDVYAFDGAVGASVIFDQLAGNNVALGWELVAPDGSVLFDRFLGDRQLVLPATGEYTLTVRGNNPDDTGTYSFQLRESPPNSPPVVDPIADRTNVEGDDVSIPITAVDPDADPLTITAMGLPPGITVDADRLAGTLIVGSASPVPYTVEITASDPLGATAVSTFSWTIELGNTAPTAVDDQAVTDTGTPIVIDVLANDTDLDGDPLHIVSTSQPLHGGADIEQDGIRYTPGAGHTGSDTFTYTVADDRGGLSEATVTVTVLPPPNSPPVIAPIADQTNDEGDDVSVPITAGDPDGDPLTITAVGLPPGVDVEASPGTSPTLSGPIAGGAASASPYTSTVTVTDADGSAAATTFTWTIDPPGTDPGSIVADVDVFAPWVCTGHPGTGSIVVVIHGSALLPTEQIDPGSIELEGMPLARLFGLPLAFRADVDHDGLDDLVGVVRDLGGIPTGADRATVTGRLVDGSMFAGSDEICGHARGIR